MNQVNNRVRELFQQVASRAEDKSNSTPQVYKDKRTKRESPNHDIKQKGQLYKISKVYKIQLKVTEVKAKTAGEIGKKRLFFITKNKGTKKKEPNEGRIQGGVKILTLVTPGIKSHEKQPNNKGVTRVRSVFTGFPLKSYSDFQNRPFNFLGESLKKPKKMFKTNKTTYTKQPTLHHPP